MEIVKGQVVISRRGRDVTQVYVATGFEGERVLLCNGESRTLANPKKKNRLHLCPTKTMLPDEDTKTDLDIKMALKHYKMQMAGTLQGG